MKLIDIFEARGNTENRDLEKAPAVGDKGELVTTAQTAKILGVTASRVRQLIMSGDLKAHAAPDKGQRDNLLKLADVNSYKAKHTGKPGPKENNNNTEKN